MRVDLKHLETALGQQQLSHGGREWGFWDGEYSKAVEIGRQSTPAANGGILEFDLAKLGARGPVYLKEQTLMCLFFPKSSTNRPQMATVDM